jgi:hypothetical protein
MHKNHRDFLAWASAYETGGMDMRSKSSVEAWMTQATCKIIRLEDDLSAEQEVERILIDESMA